jgi:feruloyl esterase
VDEMNPHLSSFAAHGGKLLLYHGWADQQVAPMSSVEFYEDAVKESGDPNAKWIRLFMAPGMGHCGGGEGPDSFDKIGALEDWVERGKAPEEIVAEHRSGGKVDRKRPLCAYPMVAKYNGTGDINDAASFHCAAR